MNPMLPGWMSHDDRSSIRRVIECQLAAFKAEDGAAALSFATPERQQFGSGERFLDMVRSGFPLLMHSRHVEFGDPQYLQGRWTQPVRVTAEDGRSVSTLYVMEQQPDGSWRIDRCVFHGPRPAPQYLS